MYNQNLNVLSFTYLFFFFVFYYYLNKNFIMYCITFLYFLTCLFWWFIYSMENLLRCHVLQDVLFHQYLHNFKCSRKID
jgi:hypothetical protein